MTIRRALLALLLAAPCSGQDIRIRPTTAPPPTTFAELRAKPLTEPVPGPGPSAACPFPDSEDSRTPATSIMLADSTTIGLPADWRVRPPLPASPPPTVRGTVSDSVLARFTPEQQAQLAAAPWPTRRDVSTRLIDRDSSRVTITRQLNGARGRTYPMYTNGVTPQGDGCLIDRGTTGALWMFYEPDPARPAASLRHPAYGDIISAEGFWYSLVISSGTIEARLRAASILTAALLDRR